MFQISSFLEPFPAVKINREARRYIIPFDQKQQGNLRSGIYPLNNKKPSESSDISSRRIEERREKGREDAPIPREDRRKVWERGREGEGGIRNFSEDPRTRTTFPWWARDADEKSKIYLPDP